MKELVQYAISYPTFLKTEYSLGDQIYGGSYTTCTRINPDTEQFELSLPTMAADPLTSRTADELLEVYAAFDSDNEDLTERPPLNTERDDKAILSPRKRKAGDDLRDEIVDEEVKITKQRRKIPKLDAERLISEAGLPKIRSLQRTGQLGKKLRLKGKGHEFSDTARLLNFYQMWLDSLYPRAKFADAVKMVEKAGHTKKLQMYRKSWIDEGKPGRVRREDVEDAFDKQEAPVVNDLPSRDSPAHMDADLDFDEDPSSMFFGGADEPAQSTHDGPDDDELEALLAQEEHGQATNKAPVTVDSEGEDDLDAILAQESGGRRRDRPTSTAQELATTSTSNIQRDNAGTNEPSQTQPDESSASREQAEEDDLDTLLNQEMGETAKPDSFIQTDNDSNDQQLNDNVDDLEGVIANRPAAEEPELPENIPQTTEKGPLDSRLPGSEEVPELENAVSSSPIPNVHTDELDQLLDEHDAIVEQRNKKADPEILEEFFSSSPLET